MICSYSEGHRSVRFPGVVYLSQRETFIAVVGESCKSTGRKKRQVTGDNCTMQKIADILLNSCNIFVFVSDLCKLQQLLITDVLCSALGFLLQ